MCVLQLGESAVICRALHIFEERKDKVTMINRMGENYLSGDDVGERRDTVARSFEHPLLF